MVDKEKIKHTIVLLIAGGIAGGILLFLIFGERFLSQRLPGSGPLVLANQPAWVSQELLEKVYHTLGAKEFPLRQESAAAVAGLLDELSWMDPIRVQIAHDSLQVQAHWHKPIALVHSGTTRFYVDANSVALEYIPLPDLPLVTIRGVRVTRVPTLGRVLEREDLKAAVDLVALLQWMDQQTVPTKPLLREIEQIDVNNFRGRSKRDRPHILLVAKDKTPIEWGAEIGTWAQFLEASDEEKLANLYTYYQERGTVQGGVKQIKLWVPRTIPQPAQRVSAPRY